MKRKSLLIVGLIIVALALSGCGIKNNTQSNKEPIKVALISSMSGEAGIWGQNLKNGFDFALAEINAKGGINGRPIQAIYEDDNCDASTGVTAFNKVIDVDGAKIITGTVCSSVAMSVAKKTQEGGILYVASGATDPEVTKQGDLIFRLWVSDDYEAKAIAGYATTNLNLKTFGIAHINDNPAGLSIENSFKATAENNGGSVLGVETFTSKEKDFKTVLTKLISLNPDAIYLVGIAEQAPLLINETRKLGYKGTVLVYGPSILAEGIIDQIGDKENIYYATPVIKQETDFWANYKKSAGKDADVLVAMGYDSLKIIEAGLIKCGEDNQCIKKYFSEMKDYQLARGKLTFNHGDVASTEFTVEKVK
ncbi:MAG: ABC transporter substrate-binding protein [Candidatus Buchananbacteria bacterium]